MTRVFLQRSMFAVCVLAFARPAAAQMSTPRVEAGGQAAVTSVTFDRHSTAFGGWLDVNLTRQLAIEARALVFSHRENRSVQVSGGVRATLVRGRRVSMYGFVLPGLYRDPLAPSTQLRFVQTGPNSYLELPEDEGPQTHFVLDFGAGLALFPTSRLVMRIELDRDLHARPGEVLTGLANTPSVVPEFIASRWNLHVGASYRFGSPLQPRFDSEPRSWTFGPQLGVTVATSETAMGTIGVFASHRLSRFCDFDASASGFVSDNVPPSLYEGGRVSQALAGVKLGVREGRFGVFLKLRGGVNSYSRALRFTPEPQLMRLTVPAIDVGGVIEASVSRRLVVRVDMGETLSFAPGGVVPPLFEDRVPHYNYPAEAIYGLPIRFGLGWRF